MSYYIKNDIMNFVCYMVHNLGIDIDYTELMALINEQWDSYWNPIKTEKAFFKQWKKDRDEK